MLTCLWRRKWGCFATLLKLHSNWRSLPVSIYSIAVTGHSTGTEAAWLQDSSECHPDQNHGFLVPSTAVNAQRHCSISCSDHITGCAHLNAFTSEFLWQQLMLIDWFHPPILFQHFQVLSQLWRLLLQVACCMQKVAALHGLCLMFYCSSNVGLTDYICSDEMKRHLFNMERGIVTSRYRDEYYAKINRRGGILQLCQFGFGPLSDEEVC